MSAEKNMVETSFTNGKNEDDAIQDKGANGDTNTMEMQKLMKKEPIEIEEYVDISIHVSIETQVKIKNRDGKTLVYKKTEDDNLKILDV